MKPITLHHGDVLAVLKTMPSDSIHCVVSSPPYWQQRDYEVAGQIGMEGTFEEWLDKTATVFDEVRRVLRPDGIFWLNVGDSYNGDRSAGSAPDQSKHGYEAHGMVKKRIPWLKKKDLTGQCWRLVFEMQKRGWINRGDLPWCKPNAKPDTAKDRPGRAHEFVFQMVKREKYFYDFVAVQWEDPNELPEYADASGNLYRLPKNLRSYLLINTVGYSEAHYATFPPALPDVLIRAGSSEHGCCAECFKPWNPVLEVIKVRMDKGNRKVADAPGAVLSPTSVFRTGEANIYRKVGAKPGCKCNAINVPCVILDPFSGSGTTGMVARRLQRHYVGIELSQKSINLALTRIVDDAPLFNSDPQVIRHETAAGVDFSLPDLVPF